MSRSKNGYDQNQRSFTR